MYLIFFFFKNHMPMNNLNKATVELNAKKETVLNLK